MRFLLLIVVVFSVFCLSLQSSCYDGHGVPYCNKSKCKKVTCKGNVGTDMCNCCDVCLKQAGEECGGEHWHLGRCDLHVPHCIKFKKHSSRRRCATLKQATELGLLLKDRTKCKKKKSAFLNGPKIECFFEMTGPTYWCKKVPMYNNDDCCVYTNQCNPNEDLYEKVKTNLDLGTLGTTYREQKKKRTLLSKKLAAASLKMLRLKMRRVQLKMRVV